MNKPLLVIEVQDISSVPTVTYNGETIEGKVSIAYEWGTSGYKEKGKHVLSLNHAYHVNNQLVERTIKEEKVTGYADERTKSLKNTCDNKTSVAEIPKQYRGIKLSETSLNIRNEIIKNDIDYLKDITPEQMELLVQLFEKENKSKPNLSNVSTTDLIEALGIRDDVRIFKTEPEVYKVEIDLFKAKKYTIVENNCDVELVKKQRNEELRIFVGQ
ncbi:hypothetical protein AB4Z03_26905 [Bacillus sp. YAF12_1]|uniref:hypothetical protein n=1 Tax=Bacillus sp. YAF12_1 TaxID=3237484 RepID=UPI003F9049ED